MFSKFSNKNRDPNLFSNSNSTNSSLCQVRRVVPASELQMLDLYETWSFENSYGGKWEQGWPISYDEKKVIHEPILEVFVVPHSHCDPGWKWTFEEYYYGLTKKILDGMAKNLEIYKDLKFIYAEIAFFEMWWKFQTNQVREKVKNLIKTGKLEIVTGGWVMTDEANSHYHSIIVELFEGHEWIKNHLGIEGVPVSHWSIDPFGLSATVPHLLRSANITNAVLQRAHYVVKRELARRKSLEFRWQQFVGDSEVRAHLMPFAGYSPQYSCGPEPDVCCQFDFAKLLDDRKCWWGKQPELINEKNVEEKSKLLYDQYRKKSQLYKNNVILVPVGDDFRFSTDSEWEIQYENYRKLMDFMNRQKNWKIHVQFGTVKEYFEKLDENIHKSGESLPTLSGDFFTYADKDDHYWSGYFTTRPFYKQLDRVLQHFLRSSEIAFSLASIRFNFSNDLIFQKLINARRALSLFQHHDGITGTSTDKVVLDYGKKMLKSIKECEEVLSASLKTILKFGNGSKQFSFDEKWRNDEQILPERHIFSIGHSVILFNSLSRKRSDSICILVDSIKASIDAESVQQQQISPMFEFDEKTNKIVAKNNIFELCFSIVFAPLEVSSYRISASDRAEKSKIYTNFDGLKIKDDFEMSEIKDEILIENEQIKAIFDPLSGMVKSIENFLTNQFLILNSHFVFYNSRTSKLRETMWAIPMKICEFVSTLLFGTNSRWCEYIEENPPGAYLFLPNSEAREIKQTQSDIVVIKGGLIKKVITVPNKELKIFQVFKLFKNQSFLDVDTEVDIRSQLDFELVLRFDSNINNGNDFYTDSNGFQMIRRKRLDKLPIQANFYPMSAAVFIEDESTRFTCHSAQPLGVSSRKSGQIDIVLDRRLFADDHRGLRQGILDNKRTISHFRLLMEQMTPEVDLSNEKIGFHSSLSQFATLMLHYPIIRMIWKYFPKSKTVKNFEDLLNSDYHLVTFRTLAHETNYDLNETKSKKKAAMIFHRIFTDCKTKLRTNEQNNKRSLKIEPLKLIKELKSARNMSLTGLYEREASDSYELQPNDISSILVTW